MLPETIRPFGEILEKRMSLHEPMIWHHTSRLYFCDVDEQSGGDCSYTANEKRFGFRCVRYTLEEALEKNRAMLRRDGEQPWNQREYRTLLLLREALQG